MNCDKQAALHSRREQIFAFRDPRGRAEKRLLCMSTTSSPTGDFSPFHLNAEIQRARRTTRELEIAREVQQRLLPGRLRSIKGLDYYGESQPVGELGGDFSILSPLAISSLLLSIGDVSGKGVPSAIIMAAVQGSLRALNSCAEFDIRKLMQNLDRMIWELAPDNFFATMFCARIDVSRQEMQYVNAGHDRAILLKRDHTRVLTLQSTGAVLGLSTKTVLQMRTVRLDPGDTLVVVTDGICESPDLEGPALERVLLDRARKHFDGSARELAEDIIQSAQTNSSHADAPSDDKTIVVVRRIEEMEDVFAPMAIRPQRLAPAVAS